MRIRLTTPALEAIIAEAQSSADGRETGGVLLGYDAGEDREALVLAAGRPGPRAERTSYFFRRDLEHAQQLADEAYTDKCARWIGEWHTHPKGDLRPSHRDLRTYRRFLRDRELGFASFLALIIGPGPEGWNRPRVAAWQIDLRRHLAALLLPTTERIEVGEPQHADTECALPFGER